MSGEVVHRLGVTVGIVLACGWLVRWLLEVRHRRRMRRRLTELSGVREATAPALRPAVRGLARTWLAPVGVVGAGWALVGGVVGVAVGLAGAVGVWRWRLRQETAGADPGAPDLAEATR
ncbi:hypothetical protein G3M58_77170, partial [Streptomyces sp. SID7499]|nr:hypothetical protein [Streptomyces sp. SID7499]